jgi:hypothetical protein
MSHVAVDFTERTNCGAPLHGVYCADCGQKATPIDPTVGHFMHDFSHEVLHFDGKIIRSCWLLLARPGFLTLELLRGRRAGYVSAIRLYLVFSVAAFAVIAMMPRQTIEVTPEDIKQAQEDAQQRQAEREARGGSDTRYGWSVNGAGPNFTIAGMSPEERRAFGEEIMHLLPRVMFVLVPVFALLVAVMARKARRHYPTHLYFALHAHAAYFAMLALTTPLELLGKVPDLIGTLGRPVYALVYLAIAFRRVYAYPRLGATLRAVAIFVAYVFTVVIAFIFTAIAAYYLQHK